MNFITSEKAYCLYPSETLESSTALLLTESVFYFEGLLKKYTSRGFKIYNVAYDNQYRHRNVRWVEDSYSFVVSLKQMETSNSWYKPIDPARLTSWSIATSPGDTHSVHFRIAAYSLDDKAYPIIVYCRAMQKLVNACNAIYIPKWDDSDDAFTYHRILS